MKYFRRIGAVCEGAGRYYVSQGYNRKYVTILEGGDVSVDEGLPPPSKAEAEEIKVKAEALRSVVVPVAPVPNFAKIPDLPGIIYEYRNKDNRLMWFVQRIQLEETTASGKPDKRCLPWIYDGTDWAQQGWPKEVPSPLFGNHHNRTAIMIHEGEKACQAAIDACRNPDHPWSDELAMFGHCTWQGGARNVSYADWREIPPDAEVWIMPDNDEEGYNCAQKLVGCLTHVKSVYLFHHRSFKSTKGWDMADGPFEDDWMNVIPGFHLAESATSVYVEDDGKVKHRLRKEFVQKFAYSVSTSEFVEIAKPFHFLKPDNFANAYAHLAPVGFPLAKSMLASPDLVRVDGIGYRPWLDPDQKRLRNATYTDESKRTLVNMYCPPQIREKKPQGLSDFRPLLAYLRYLMPEPRERKIVIRWASCMLAGRRLPWAVLMISQMTGTGKSTLARFLRSLVGPGNSSQVQPTTLQDKFTSWALNKQLIVVPELKEGSAFQLAEHLKTFIEDPTIPIRRMNVDQYDAENHLSIIASSNHMSALSLQREDRRWFLPRITEVLPPPRSDHSPLASFLGRYLRLGSESESAEFFLSAREWFYELGGMNHCLWVARRYGRKLYESGWHRDNIRSPNTHRRTEVIQRSKFEWQTQIEDLVEDAQFVCREDLKKWLDEHGPNRVKASDIGRFMEEMGLLTLYQKPESPDVQVRAGRISMFVKPDKNGQLKGHIHGRLTPTSPPPAWVSLRSKMTWFSLEFRAAVAGDAF